MRDLPALFSGSMVRALIREIEQPGAGKTQTRRVLTKLRRFGKIRQFGQSDTRGYDWHFRDKGCRWHDLRHKEMLAALPYSVGDRLYVREAWRSWRWNDDLAPSEMPVTWARNPDQYVSYVADEDDVRMDGRLRPGMHMPRWASRITLLVTDVRVQRLQEISEEDAIAEGVESDSDGYRDYLMPATQCCGNARDSFRSLWDNLNADRGFGWDANPWVAAYAFRPILGNIDEVQR